MSPPALQSPLPELEELERIIEMAGSRLEIATPATVEAGGRRLPVYTLALGARQKDAPAMAFIGGVHGLERIGTRVVTAFLRSLVARLGWDMALHAQLDQVRLVFMPLVNPGGMLRGTRANPNGVDLMRNAPLDAQDGAPFLVGGQRLSAGLPWYRGPAGGPMEAESRALCALVEQELQSRPFSLAIDCHSGFGMRDRLWFPHAHSRVPMAHLPELYALRRIFEQAHGHHPYIFEPQSRQYLAHGDLWDHLYLGACRRGTGILLPLTLEMGSWIWVRKNPRQLFSRHGIFNPLIAHREQRVLRRHFPLFDFAMRAAAGWKHWLPTGRDRVSCREAAIGEWYTAAAA